MTDNGKNDQEEWACQRCTAKNHPGHKYCEECLNPRTVSYPNIAEELPIPEFFNPFPEKEFTNISQESFAAAHTPKRREQRPDVTPKMDNHGSSPPLPNNIEPRDFDSNPEPNVPSTSEFVIGELPMSFDQSNSKDSSLDSAMDLYNEGSLKQGSTPDNGDGTMDSNEFRLSPIQLQVYDTDEPPLTGSQNIDDPDLDMDKFRLPPLPNFPEAMTVTTNSPISTSPQVATITTRTTTQPHTVDAFMEQSASGFKNSDFDVKITKQKPNISTSAAIPLDLTTTYRFNMSQGVSIQAKPVDVPENHTKPENIGGNVLNSLSSPPFDFVGGSQFLPAQTGTDWYSPYSRISKLGLQSGNPFSAASGSSRNEKHDPLSQRFPTPSGAAIDLRGSEVPPLPKPPYPPGLSPPRSAGEAVSNRTPAVTMTTPSNQQLRKVKPVKTNRPIPNLGLPSSNPNSSLSANQIMSLFDHNEDLRPTTENPPEVASVRSAAPAVSSIDDPSFFDPFAPPPKVPNFKDEHFGDDSQPMQEETQNPATSSQGETVPTSTSTTSVASGGARRKIPRTQPSTVPTQTHLYTGPSTSRGAPPPEPMVLDQDGKWPCPLCTFANRVSAQYCEVCHDGRPPWYTGETMSPIIAPSAQSGSEDRVLQHGPREQKSKAFVDEWICQGCTRSNQPEHGICMSCGLPRPSGFTLPRVPGPAPVTEPKRTASLVSQGPDIPSTSQQRMELTVPTVSRPTTSRQHSFSDNFSSLRTSSVGSATSGSAVRSIAMEDVRKDQERHALEIFNGIIVYCRESDEKFVDDQFIPSQRSLQFPNATFDYNIAHANWLRPHQINSGNRNDQLRTWTVFCPEGPASTDIQQGILGNCWFLSGLSVLVERPQLLRKIFVTSEYSQYGAYLIRLCKDGVWQTVIIDDLLPCNNNGELLYTQAVRKQLWVPLIEKALAKSHGCYEALQAGRSIEGLATLTGAPCESLQLVAGPDLVEPEPDMIWVRLLSAREAGYLMGASCGGANMDVDETIYEAVNLRVRHAYSVLDVRIERMDSGEAVKLLQLRNPWAQQSWSGAWHDRDPRWYNNPRMEGRLNPNQSNHGIFWLSFDDMLKYFDSVDICKIRDNKWSEIRTEGDFPDSAVLPPCSFFLEVFQSTEIDLSIFQQGSRSQEGSGRHPVDLCICVFRSSAHAASSAPGSQVVLGPLIECSRRQVKRHGSCSHFFEPGVYQVVTLAFNHWMSAFGGGVLGGHAAAFGAGAAPMEHPKFVLALHSSRAISLSQFRGHPTLLADATIELVMKRGEKKDVRECSTCYYLTRGWAGLIVVAENRHPSRHMQIVCDCLDSRNVVSTRGSLKTADCIPPLHKQVIIVLTQLDGHSGFTITHKLVHRMGVEGLGEWSQVPGNHDPVLTPDVKALHMPRPL